MPKISRRKALVVCLRSFFIRRALISLGSLLRGWEGAEGLADDSQYLFLLVVIQPLHHIFDDAVESRNGTRAEIDDHDHLAFRQVIRVKLLNEKRDRFGGVGERALTQRVWVRLEVLENLVGGIHVRKVSRERVE